MLEDFSDTFVCLGRALKVLVGTDLLADILTLKRVDQHLYETKHHHGGEQQQVQLGVKGCGCGAQQVQSPMEGT